MTATAPRIVLTFDSLESLQREFDKNLRTGGAFAAGASPLPERSACLLVLIHPESHDEISLTAEVVYVKPDAPGMGVGVHIQDFGPALIERLRAFVQHAPPTPPPEPSTPEEPHRPASTAIIDKLRNISVAEQLKVAREGGLPQRVALERLYGKTVWEPILQNTRVTPPEVARIARMGMAPVTLIEFICSNAAWLASGEVRRALLSNPRLGDDSLSRVLRAMPRHELTVIANQTYYAPKVRKAAKAILQR